MDLIEAEPYSRQVIGCAIEVHKTLGPGLIELIYEACLCQELAAAGLAFVRQRKLPVVYKCQRLDAICGWMSSSKILCCWKSSRSPCCTRCMRRSSTPT